MSYCGSAVVKVYSGIGYKQFGFSSEANYGSFLAGTLIPQAQKIIDSYCNHDFSDHSGGTITVDGTGKNYVIIPPAYAPLQSLTSVEIDGVAKTVTDFKCYDQYIVFDDGWFTEDEQNVVIVADYGYDSVPDDVAYTCTQLCASMLREIIRSKTFPDLLVPLLEAGVGEIRALMGSPKIFTKELKDLLQKYVYVQLVSG